MVLQTNGEITASNVKVEFNGVFPLLFSDYYPDTFVGYAQDVQTLPTTGTPIGLSNFRGIEKRSSIYDGLSSNVLSNMNVVYSMRLVNPNYKGPALRVRRANDNVQADFYASPLGNLRVGSNVGSNPPIPLPTWLGSNQGFVTTWYDQVGSNHATQTTTGLQPEIVWYAGSNFLYFKGALTGFTMTTSNAPVTMLANLNTHTNATGYNTIMATLSTDSSWRIFNNNIFGAGVIENTTNYATTDYLTTSNSFVYLNSNYTKFNANANFTLGTGNIYNYRWNNIIATRTQSNASPIWFQNIGAINVGGVTSRSLIGYMGELMFFNTSLTASDAAILWNNRFITTDVPPVLSGLMGWYEGDTFNNTTKQWFDKSGRGNHTSLFRGTPTISSNMANGLPALFGGVNDGIRFPTSILPSTFTLFHLTRYRNPSANRFRIVCSPDTNWLNGHHGGNAGVAHHNNWLTAIQDVHHNQWVLSSSTNTTYRSGLGLKSTAAGGTPNFANLTVNYGINNTEYSDWACAMVMVYNRNLSATEMLAVEQWLASKYMGLPIQNGLIGWYDGDSFSVGNQIWYDKCGMNNHASRNRGTCYIAANFLNGKPIVYGGVNDGIAFPAAILPSTYTLFHVARYNGTRLRIFSNTSGTNYLSGFWNGNAGVAYHNAWLTPVMDLHGNNWVLSTDQNQLYRSNGVQRSTPNNPAGSPSFANLTLNGSTGEYSDWICALVIVYNRTLTQNEIELMESWINEQYSIIPPQYYTNRSGFQLVHSQYSTSAEVRSLNNVSVPYSIVTYSNLPANVWNLAHDEDDDTIFYAVPEDTRTIHKLEFTSNNTVSGTVVGRVATATSNVISSCYVPSALGAAGGALLTAGFTQGLIHVSEFDSEKRSIAYSYSVPYLNEVYGVEVIPKIATNYTLDFVVSTTREGSNLTSWVVDFNTRNWTSQCNVKFTPGSNGPLNGGAIIYFPTNKHITAGDPHTTTHRIALTDSSSFSNLYVWNMAQSGSNLAFTYLKTVRVRPIRNFTGAYPYHLSTNSMLGLYNTPIPMFNFDSSLITGLQPDDQITSWPNNGYYTLIPSSTAAGTTIRPRLRFRDGFSHVEFDRTQAQHFNGGAVTFANFSQMGYGGLTVLAVVQFTGTVGSYERIIDFGSGAPNGNILMYREGTTNTLRSYVINGTTQYAEAIATNTLDSQWRIYAATFTNSASGGTITTYRDFATSNVGSANFAFAITNRTVSASYIGRTWWTNDAYLNANMRQLLMYERALNTAELTQVFRSLRYKWGFDQFVPTDISGMNAWLDASENTYVTLSGSNVTQWSDRSGAANHGSNIGAGAAFYSTNQINGKSAVMFTPNGNQAFRLTTASSATTIFAVGRPTLDNVNHIFVGAQPAEGGLFGAYYFKMSQTDSGVDSDEAQAFYANTSDTYTYSKINYNSNQNTLYAAWFGSNTQNMRLNGGALSNSTAFTGTRKTATTTYIGAAWYNGSIQYSTHVGPISELIFYNRQLSIGEIEQVEGYLAHKYGFTLPDSHTFRHEIPRRDNFLYSFTSFTFNNANTTGRLGPSLAAVQGAYSGTSWTQNTAYLDVTSGVQVWTVPRSATYSIEAAGAAGGTTFMNRTPGPGRIVSGNAYFTMGTKIYIIVGQRGTGTTNAAGGGGGGGTFVFSSTTSPLIVAGGGGGSAWNDGSAGNTTSIGGSAGGAGGSNGTGGFGAAVGGGNGSSGTGGTGGVAGTNQVAGGGGGGGVPTLITSQGQGGAGGNTTSVGGDGGFGGGGGGGGYPSGGQLQSGAGGGGGYSGGGGGDGAITGGGGGGSFFAASVVSQNSNVGTNANHGYVTIQFLNANPSFVTILDNSISKSPTLISGNTYFTSFTSTSGTNTIQFLQDTYCDILVIGGGGSGGTSIGGGGGAGGVVYMVNKLFSAGVPYAITIGNGGPTGGTASTGTGNNGSDSFIQTGGTDITFDGLSVRGRGGGFGGSYYNDANNATYQPGKNGGSGGGASDNNSDVSYAGGSTTQGNTYWNGSAYIAGGSAGRANTAPNGAGFWYAGGGGGMGTAGATNKDGHSGIQNSITGTAVWYAAGGGGGTPASTGSGVGGNGGGTGGRGNIGSKAATNGTAASGSGGGGGGYVYIGGDSFEGGTGGSGIVVLRFSL
jgi:hypothetical protein